ncbi:Uteroglobin [Manis javanica]|nr:Uteroglobin [Manis javanica]
MDAEPPSPASRALRLAVTLALGALALCGTSEICQSFLNAVKNFFMGTLANYEAPIEPFNPEVDMKDAGFLLKKLVDPPPETSQDSTVEFAACSFLRSHCLLLESSPFQRLIKKKNKGDE